MNNKTNKQNTDEVQNVDLNGTHECNVVSVSTQNIKSIPYRKGDDDDDILVNKHRREKKKKSKNKQTKKYQMIKIV
ncbi:hypothetical protein DERP_014056 [Dermatophagoides pteronyssinus]|uniref:Uncharacterized protein n=1 Tax=Dermatophagoides pteronyssinus TaxID=6956 RepID=A0ABQ8JDD9_DERPT|nr:hypothetical protein DERP_014056 [Dermatophagoides pteronyssinus]